MDEASFLTLADTELAQLETLIQDAVDASGVDCDIEIQAGGILQLEFANGGKIIINRHSAAREIWVAARSGGFHFRPLAGRWVAARDGAELHGILSELISRQAGTHIKLG